jgi:hypothetical protein
LYLALVITSEIVPCTSNSLVTLTFIGGEMPKNLPTCAEKLRSLPRDESLYERDEEPVRAAVFDDPDLRKFQMDVWSRVICEYAFYILLCMYTCIWIILCYMTLHELSTMSCCALASLIDSPRYNVVSGQTSKDTGKEDGRPQGQKTEDR